MMPQTKAQFDGMVEIIRENLSKSSGEIYCFIVRKQKRSAFYARQALSEIIKVAKQLRIDLLAAKKLMPVKKMKGEKKPIAGA